MPELNWMSPPEPPSAQKALLPDHLSNMDIDQWNLPLTQAWQSLYLPQCETPPYPDREAPSASNRHMPPSQKNVVGNKIQTEMVLCRPAPLSASHNLWV